MRDMVERLEESSRPPSRSSVRSAVLLSALLIALVGLRFNLGLASVSGSPTDWQMYRFDSTHSGATPDVVNPPLAVKWTFRPVVPGLGPIPFTDTSPAVSGGVVYIASDDGTLYAIDEATGTRKWNYTERCCGGSWSLGSPAVENGLVYINVGDGSLDALDAATGTLKWKDPLTAFRAAAMPSSPTFSDGVVYVGGGSDTAYALDALTGAVKWKYAITPALQTTSMISPAVAGGVVYIGSGDSYLYALDAETGALKWSWNNYTFSRSYAFPSNSAVSDGVVYLTLAGVLNSVLYTLDASAGTMKWKFATNPALPRGASANRMSSPAIAGGVVYLGSQGSVYALDAITGALRWNHTIEGPTVPTPVLFDPAVSGGFVYIGSIADGVLALDAATGALRWSYGTDAPLTVFSSSVVSGGTVYVGASDAVYAFVPEITPGATASSSSASSVVSITTPTEQSSATIGSTIIASTSVTKPSSLTTAPSLETIQTVTQAQTTLTPVLGMGGAGGVLTYAAIGGAVVAAIMLLGVFLARRTMRRKGSAGPTPVGTTRPQGAVGGMVCHSCGRQLGDYARFCDRCGAIQHQQTP